MPMPSTRISASSANRFSDAPIQPSVASAIASDSTDGSALRKPAFNPSRRTKLRVISSSASASNPLSRVRQKLNSES